MFGRLLGVARGTVAWLVGYLLTLGLVAVGAVDGGSGVVGTAARTFLEAHVFPPADAGVEPLALAVLPLLAVGAVGYRTGARRQSGLLGRVRSLLASARSDDRSRERVRFAVRTGLILAIGYALFTALVALALEIPVGTVAASAFLTALVVAVPAAFVGTMR